MSAEPLVESAEPEIRIVGGIHGNECMSVDIVLEIIEMLVTGYGDDPSITELLDSSEIVFVPLANPDGYSRTPARRSNAKGVDINRNFGFAWLGEGESPFSEPETDAIRSLSQGASFTVGLTYHTVDKYVNSPWNYTPHHPPDEQLLEAMGMHMRATRDTDRVFGWDWYDIYGDSQRLVPGHARYF